MAMPSARKVDARRHHHVNLLRVQARPWPVLRPCLCLPVLPGEQFPSGLLRRRAGVAMLSLYTWLMGLRARLAGGGHGGRGALPAALAVVTDKGKGSKEQGNLVVKEAVAAMMTGWGAPFKCARAAARLFWLPCNAC